jgi:transposase
MRDFAFPSDVLEIVRHERYHHPHPRVQQKMEVIWLKSQGLTHDDIARLAGLSRRSVQRYLDEYLDGGIDRLYERRWKGKRCPLDDCRTSLEEYFVEHPPRTTREARDAIRHPSQSHPGPRLPEKKVGLSWRKAGTIPGKADPDEQSCFLSEELEPRLEEARAGERSVWFVDAAHFVHGSFLGYLWCLVRYFVPSPSGRKRYNVLGALNAVTHQMVRVSNHSYINALSVCELLVELASAGRRSRPTTLVLDNARYQRCELVRQTAESLGIELLFLPSYSPNLNLIERVWKFVQKESLASYSLATYEAFIAAIDGCLDRLHSEYRARMDTLLSHRFQTFDDVPVLSA